MPLIRCAGRVSSRSASSDQRALTRANRDRVSETAKTGRSGGFGPFDGKTCTVDTDFGRKRLPGPASIAICSLGVPAGGAKSVQEGASDATPEGRGFEFAVLGGVPVRGTHGSATSGSTQAFDPDSVAWYAREPGRLSRGHQHGPVCTSRQADAIADGFAQRSRRITSATACSPGVPALNPSIVPSISAALRFWVSFSLASIRAIRSSRPTIARACVRT